MKLTRRHVLHGGTALVAAPFISSLPFSHAARAQDASGWRHGLSLFGELKYKADFKHYDYVNPNAPKGGVARTISMGTFDNFNIVVSGVKGNLAPAAGLIYDSLMASSLDEPSTQYGELAEAVKHPDDFSSATYRLRANARWHDGKPVTADDVIFSLNAFKQYSPMYMAYYSHVVKAEKTGEHEVTFTFRWSRQSRIADHRRAADHSAEALVGRHGRVRQQA